MMIKINISARKRISKEEQVSQREGIWCEPLYERLEPTLELHVRKHDVHRR